MHGKLRKERSDHMNNEKNKKIDEISFQAKFAAPAADCTGLIPSGGNSEDELENYEELYPFLPPANEEEALMKRKREREQ